MLSRAGDWLGIVLQEGWVCPMKVSHHNQCSSKSLRRYRIWQLDCTRCQWVVVVSVGTYWVTTAWWNTSQLTQLCAVLNYILVSTMWCQQSIIKDSGNKGYTSHANMIHKQKYQFQKHGTLTVNNAAIYLNIHQKPEQNYSQVTDLLLHLFLPRYLCCRC